MFSPPAVAAKGPSPDGVELLDERIDEGGVFGEDTVLEVALSLRLCPHPCAGEVRAAEIRLHAIHDDAFEMDTRTKHPFHRSPKRRIAVEVVPPVRLGLLRPLRGSVATLLRATRCLRHGRIRVFRMNKPHLDPALNHPV